MEIDPFIERILETENLTDELEDNDARWLSHWGVAKLAELLQEETDFECAGRKTNRLMAVMRKINRMAGSLSHKRPEDLAGDLKELEILYEEAFTGIPRSNPADLEEVADHLKNLSTHQVLEVLTRTNRAPWHPV